MSDPLEAARKAQLAEHYEGEPVGHLHPDDARRLREIVRDDPGSQQDVPDLPAGFVVHGHGTGYFVRSRSEEGVWWLVSGRSCSCPAGRAGSPRCWHRSAVAAFVAKLDEATKRPVAPPNVSALVD